MKFFRRSYFPKVVIAIALLVQFLAIFILAIWISTQIKGNSESFATTARVIFALLGIVFLVDILISVHIINGDSAEIYKITWIFFVFALPIVGIILYIVIANKATSKKSRRHVRKRYRPIQTVPTEATAFTQLQEKYPYFEGISSYLSRVSGGGIHQETTVKYFPLVDDAFEPILEELRKAKHYIFMEFFIIGEGKFFGSILEILKEKASQGVDVRIIYDDVGSISSIPFRYTKTLESYGIKAHCYNPFRPFLDIRMNNRDHRKILVVDGHTCFSGGFNVADEYINAEERFGHWKDNAILLKGRAVSNFTMMFLALWKNQTKSNEEIDKAYYDASHFIDEIGGFPEGVGFVQPYTDLPFDKHAVGQRVYIDICNYAKRYLYIATPYLMIDKEMENAIIYASTHGVDVRVLTPHIPDKGTVFQITRSSYGALLKAGVRVYEYTPGFVHEKVFISDDVVSTCGTINLDYRSLYLHLECGTLMVGTPSVVDMKDDFLATLEKSEEITMEKWLHWEKRNLSYWALLRLFAPLL